MSLDQPNTFVKHQTITRDAFLGGRLTLSQPSHGFRAGMDSVLLGAAIADGRKNLLDMGSGVGAAAFVALTHSPELRAILAEQNASMLDLARRNAVDNGMAARVQFATVDVAGTGASRIAAGLAENAYDAVIANPPFFDNWSGTLSNDAGRAASRHMDATMLDRWVKTAAGHAAAGGEIVFIYPSESLNPLLAAFAQRFGAVTVLPLSSRPAALANRVLVRGIKGSRAPLKLLASRPLHLAEGRAFQPEFDSIFRGLTRLVW